MKLSSSSEYDEKDREVIKLLEQLGSLKPTYPPELLAARRAAFLAHVEELKTPDIDEELSAGEQEIVHLLGALKPAEMDYPPHLLAARRSALLQQLSRVEAPRVRAFDKLRASLQRIFSYKATPAVPGFRRISLVIASLIAAAFFGSLLFRRAEQAFQPSFLQGSALPTRLFPTSTREAAILVCKPDDPAPSCSHGALDPSQDLANAGNGTARPAVSNDGVYRAAYVNDGYKGASWVSARPDSWIKIDLGQVSMVNTVSLQNASTGASGEENPGQFVIAVALSDVYTDGDNSNDDVEYTQVFHSEQTGFSGRVSQAETIRTQFSPVQARYVKITFEDAGAAIEEVGIFMVEPPKPPTHTPHGDLAATTLTPAQINTLSLTNTATSVPASTSLPTDAVVTTTTDISSQADTPTPLPTNTLPPPDTATPVPTEPLPSDTPIPLLPTVVPPTAIPTTVEPPPASTDPIRVTGSGQTLTFTCNGNAAEIRGHANTVTLLGSCSSITVTGNGNSVFWQSGSPVITNRGKDNIIRQL